MKQLAPKAIWLFFAQSIVGFTVIFLFLAFFFGPISAIFFESISGNYFITTSILGIILIILLIILSFIWAKLSYNNYKYEAREDGFRKESGVVFKKYVTIPYERIQNVDIYRGILARMLGLSDLHIQTAGNSGGGKYGMGAEGRLPGLTVQDAESMRDELIRRSKGQYNAQSNIISQAIQSQQSNQGGI